MQYVSGAWNVVCDRCGFKFRNKDLRKEWTGLMVCSGPRTNDCWEPRHPQETLKAKKDRQSPPWVRPVPAMKYLRMTCNGNNRHIYRA